MSDVKEVLRNSTPGPWNVFTSVGFIVNAEDKKGYEKYQRECFTFPYDGNIQALTTALDKFLRQKRSDDIVGMSLQVENAFPIINENNYVYKVLGDFTKTKLKNIKFLYIEVNIGFSIPNDLPCNSDWGVPNCFSLNNLEYIESWVPLPMLSNTIKNCKKLQTIYSRPRFQFFAETWETFLDIKFTPKNFKRWYGFVPSWALPDFGDKLNVVQTLDLDQTVNISDRPECLQWLSNPLLKLKGLEANIEWILPDKQKHFCELILAQCNTLEYIKADIKVIEFILGMQVRFPHLKTIYTDCSSVHCCSDKLDFESHDNFSNTFPCASSPCDWDRDEFLKNSVTEHCDHVLWNILRKDRHSSD